MADIAEAGSTIMEVKTRPVALYAATLNDRLLLDRFLENIPLVDLAVIADRGSSDGSCQLLRARGAQVIDASGLSPAEARAAALAAIPPDHICVALEPADLLLGDLRQCIAARWQEDTRVGLHAASWFPGGATRGWIDITLGRVHAHFAAPITDNALGDAPAGTVALNGISIEHRPHPRALHSGGLVGERPDALNQGLALLLQGRLDSAAAMLALAPANISAPDLRRDAWRLLGATQRLRRKIDKAEAALRAASGEYPPSRDVLTDLLTLLHAEGNWEACLAVASTAETLPWTSSYRPGALRNSENAPFDLGSIAAHNTGQTAQALRLGHAALARDPGNQRIRENVKFYRDAAIRAGIRTPPIIERPQLLLVSGPWSGGTSAVAGVLQRLGAQGLAPYLATSDERTPSSYESLAFTRAIDAGTKRSKDAVWRSDTAQAESLLAELREDIAWGTFTTGEENTAAPYFAKYPASALVIENIAAIFDVKLIVVRRPLEKIEKTRKRRGWPALYGAAGALLINAALDAPESRKVTAMEVEYEKLLDDPKEIIKKISKLIGEMPEYITENAISFIADNNVKTKVFL